MYVEFLGLGYIGGGCLQLRNVGPMAKLLAKK